MYGSNDNPGLAPRPETRPIQSTDASEVPSTLCSTSFGLKSVKA